jgi:hypothetical protein
MTKRIGRRGFVAIGAGTAAAVAGLGFARNPEAVIEPAAVRLADALRHSTDVTELGREYLDAKIDESSEPILRDKLGEALGGRAPLASTSELAARLRTRVQEEFKAGDTFQMEGWVFSRTEIRLFALAALRSPAGRRKTVLLAPEPDGLLDPEATSDGRRAHWTRPEATFYIAPDARALDLSVRSGAPFPQQLTIRRDGAAVATLQLTDQSWQRHQSPLSVPPKNGRFFEVTLAVEPAWRPPSGGRSVGVLLAENQWTR